MREVAIDVVLQTTGVFAANFAAFQESPPMEEDFELAPDVTIGLLPDFVSGDQIMDACSPAGFNFQPTRLYGYRYAFVRRIDTNLQPTLNWDDDHLLRKILFLSRLIHPTTVAGCYSARLLIWNGELRTIVPGQTQGVGAYSYIVAEQWRDWLTLAEAQNLRELLPKYLARTPSVRLRQARRHIDHAFHAFYLDQRITYVVTALESLLKVGRNQLTNQFKKRLSQLALKFGEAVSEDAAEDFYNERSGIVHGSGPHWKADDSQLILNYQLFERVLRRAILRASTEDDFAALFRDDDSVRTGFPV